MPNKVYQQTSTGNKFDEFVAPSEPVQHLNFGQETEVWAGKYDYSEVDNPKVYSRWFHWGSMPNAVSVTKPHGIANVRKMISRRGVALSAAGSGFDFPFAAATAANNVGVTSDATNIILTPGSDRRSNDGWVLLEYTCTDR